MDEDSLAIGELGGMKPGPRSFERMIQCVSHGLEPDSIPLNTWERERLFDFEETAMHFIGP